MLSFNPLNSIASPAPQRRILVKPPSSPKNHQHRPPPPVIGAARPPPSNLDPPSPATTPGNRRRKDIGDYWLGKTLGKGSSGRVKLGIHKISGEKVAIKIISKSHLAANASVERAVKREIAVMKLIHHPNIMSLLDVIDLSDSPNLYLILEYVQGGELFEYLVSQGRLSEPEARKYFQQIIFGLDYCHRHLICHRDLKPENLLLDQDKNIKIADFGMASLQPAGSLLETSCGSPHYASPEIVTGVPYNGAASDIWSCGIILYALLCGHLPFDDDNIRELLNKVKIGKYKMPDHISESARDLIRRILVIRPEKRLTMKEVQTHPWFTADPPPNPSILPDPPTASEIGRPVADASEIDERLLETLKVLWTDLSTEEVIEALLNDEYNMQKVTYVLLQRHATNYWQVDRDDDVQKESPAKRRRPATICAVASSKEPLPGIDDIMCKIALQEEKATPTSSMSPSTQRHSLQSQQLSRQHSPSRLQPITPEENAGTQTACSTPPPFPLEPSPIRSDVAKPEASSSYKSPRVQKQQQWTYTPAQYQRHDVWRQALAIASPSQHRQCTPRAMPGAPPYQFHSPASPLVGIAVEQREPCPYPCSQHHPYFLHHQQHPPPPPPPPPPPQPQYLYPMYPQHHPEQHLNVAHMLSPRAPATRVFHAHCQQPAIIASVPCHHHHYGGGSGSLNVYPEPCSSMLQPTASNQQPPSKLNRLVHLWQRNRVEPSAKSPKASHRLSMPTPQTQLEYDRTMRPAVAQEDEEEINSSRNSACNAGYCCPGHNRGGYYSVVPSPAAATCYSPRRPGSSWSSSTTSRPSSSSPRLSSWLPGLFHFKQPKVCSIDCLARDEREAIGKITQVLEECMEGRIIERRDSDGHIRRKGEMTLPGNAETAAKPVLLRFKLEVNPPQQVPGKPRTVRVNFIQQQGDAVALMTAVRMVERTLQAYEQEANLIATANGWTTSHQAFYSGQST